MRAQRKRGGWRRLAVVGLGVVPALAAQAPARQAGAAANAMRALELEDYYRIETATAPALSPDGKRVAYVRTYLVENENRRQSEIWLAPTDGPSSPRRLSNPPFGAGAPRPSPHRTLLALTPRRRLLAAAA